MTEPVLMKTSPQDAKPMEAGGLESLSVESNPKLHRKHFFVDPKLQISLMFRVTFYWLLGVLTLGATLLCWRVVAMPRISFRRHWEEFCFYDSPALLIALILLPPMIIDILRFSNRFVGPMLRLRRSLRQLARGEHVDPVVFRENDFWQELAQEIDAALIKIQGNETTTPQANSSISQKQGDSR